MAQREEDLNDEQHPLLFDASDEDELMVKMWGSDAVKLLYGTVGGLVLYQPLILVLRSGERKDLAAFLATAVAIWIFWVCMKKSLTWLKHKTATNYLLEWMENFRALQQNMTILEATLRVRGRRNQFLAKTQRDIQLIATTIQGLLDHPTAEVRICASLLHGHRAISWFSNLVARVHALRDEENI